VPLKTLHVVCAYLLGSIPFGVLLTRWRMGVDVRSQGSGNIGATNVARVAGKAWGALVLLLDAAKGALPVACAVALFPDGQGPNVRGFHAGVALAAFLGHLFPPWLRFKGGKGVATALGVLLVLEPAAALAGLGAFAVVVGLWRKSSLGSLTGGLLCVTVAFLSARPREYALLALLLFSLMLITHRRNLQRLLERNEPSV